MARHYRQTRRDREHESRGMRRYERRHHRRHHHREHHARVRHHGRHHDHHHYDEMMMPHDASEHMGEETQLYHMGRAYYGPGYGHPSNLPPHVDMKHYPKEKEYLDNYDYPDTLREIDGDEEHNMDNLERQPPSSMY